MAIAHLFNATTERTPAVGSLRKAKSRCASHMAVSELGSNVPTPPATDRPRLIDFFRNVPLPRQHRRAPPTHLIVCVRLASMNAS